MINKAHKSKKRLILILSLLLTLGFLTTTLVSYFVSRSSLRDQISTSSLPLTSDNIYSEIQRDLFRPIQISSMMAHDIFLRDWVLTGERNIEDITRYLRTVKEEYHTFTSFFVSEKSRRYYHSQGILKKVKSNEERDAWYYRVRDMGTDYELNIDPDMANQDTMTIFINHKVFDYTGGFIGAVGVGLQVNAVKELMERYSNRYNRNIYFTDPDGNLTLYNFSFGHESENIREEEGLGLLADSLLSSPQTATSYIRQNKTIHLNTRYVPEFDWYLFVEQTEEDDIRSIHNALIMNLIFFVIITAIAITLTILTINVYQRVTRKQQDEILGQHQDLLAKNLELERAFEENTKVLERNQLLMQEMNHRVKNNLATILSLLRLQSRSVSDDASKVAFQESENRIRSIKHIHELLSGSTNLRKVEVSGFFRKVIQDLAESYMSERRGIEIQQHIDPIDLDIDTLIPFSLLVNELITNAFKYAFTESEAGLLYIALHSITEKRVELVVRDNGIGLPPGFNLQQQDTMGMSIVRMLAEQIHADLSCKSDPDRGAEFRLILNIA